MIQDLRRLSIHQFDENENRFVAATVLTTDTGYWGWRQKCRKNVIREATSYFQWQEPLVTLVLNVMEYAGLQKTQ